MQKVMLTHLVKLRITFSISIQRWGIADAEIKVPFTQNPSRSKVVSFRRELSKVPSFKPEAGQSIALHASSTASSSAFVISTFLVHSPSFLPTPLEIHKVTCVRKSESDFDL